MVRLVVAVLMLFAVPAFAGKSAVDVAFVVPPTMKLPSHTTLVLAPAQGWEPERVRAAVAAALANPTAGLDPETDVATMPKLNAGAVTAVPVVVAAADAAAPAGSLVLSVVAHQQEPEDKWHHMRRNYDHKYKVDRRTSLRIDFQITDPATGVLVGSATSTAEPKPNRGKWDTNEAVAAEHAADPGEMALAVLDQIAAEIAAAVRPRWQIRRVDFRPTEYSSNAIGVVVASRRPGQVDELLERIIGDHPDSLDDRRNLAMALVLLGRLSAAERTVEELLNFDRGKDVIALLDEIRRWDAERAALASAGFLGAE